MIFRENTVSVLVISGSREFGNKIAELMPSSEYWPVNYAANGGEARRRLTEQDYDIIIINSPLPDESGIRIAEDVSEDSECGILLFVKAGLYDEVYGRVMERGIMVLQKPASLQLVSQVIRLLCTMKERFNRMKKKQATVEDKIKEIRIVNRAKWLLIEKEKLNEKEAHHRIERLAMDERISRSEAAERIISQYPD